MRCESCEGRLEVEQTYSAGPGSKTAAAVCADCGTRYTLVTVALEATQQGARSMATALKNGHKVDRTGPRHDIRIMPLQISSDSDF